jgi:N-acetylglucosaminyldiphosphoundecaprenol N-acetyl-beta-D-mannosaminyltransferase
VTSTLPTSSPACYNILGINLSAINMDLALSQITTWIANRIQEYVCVTNVHVVMEAQRNLYLRRILNRAGMVTPDGMPLVWIGHLGGFTHIERVYGPDLMLAVCHLSQQKGWRQFFYGGASGVAERLVARLSIQYPGLIVAGCDTPPFRSLSLEEDQADIDKINASGADIVWVGLGAPKQEIWMAEHLSKINAPVMIGVGAAFDFHAGLKPQAPIWMQRSGLEWFFRLISEPRRLWKRYLINNPLFLLYTLMQLTGFRTYPIEK